MPRRPGKGDRMRSFAPLQGDLPVQYPGANARAPSHSTSAGHIQQENSQGAKPELRRNAYFLWEIAEDYDVRSLTPRKMVELSFDLYSAGFLDRHQYTDLAFQAELMPNHDTTIGALTGKKAAPDRPRDFTVIWRDRLIFEQTYSADDPGPAERAESILKLLLSLKKPAKLDRRQSARHRRQPTPLDNIPALSLRGNR